ncbi:MAG: transposase [Pseudomonadota bacterium]|nr:transposase [Pseudomonadota bacterium]
MPYDDLRKGRHSETHRAYFVTTVLAERQLRLFADLFIARLVVAEMRALHQSGTVNSFAWVVMPDHVHWLLQLGESIDLSATVKRFKARSAHRVNQRLNRRGSLWQRAFHDHAVREEEDVKEIARYIVANPLRAGLAQNIGDYPLWDATWL